MHRVFCSGSWVLADELGTTPLLDLGGYYWITHLRLTTVCTWPTFSYLYWTLGFWVESSATVCLCGYRKIWFVSELRDISTNRWVTFQLLFLRMNFWSRTCAYRHILGLNFWSRTCLVYRLSGWTVELM